jgi:hypothetical protein
VHQNDLNSKGDETENQLLSIENIGVRLELLVDSSLDENA